MFCDLPIAHSVTPGGVIVTQNEKCFLDIGYVSTVTNGSPKVVLAQWTQYADENPEHYPYGCPHYGGVDHCCWYDTGIRTTKSEWIRSAKIAGDAGAFHQYWSQLILEHNQRRSNMSYKKGDKFTIEITDVMTGEDGKTVYRMNDFSSLVFDDKGLDRLDRLDEKVVEPEKKSPFERVVGEHYWNIGGNGAVNHEYDNETEYEAEALKTANYCTDKFMMEQRALHETLNRLLWRYSEEHGGDVKWNGINKHWVIAWNPVSEQVEEHHVTLIKENGNVYFNSQLSAIGAIREVVEPFLEEHPEFIW